MPLCKSFTKKKSTLEGALEYSKLAFKTYENIKVEIKPINEGFWKYIVTVSEK